MPLPPPNRRDSDVYKRQQWGRSANELPAFIIKRIPFRFTYDNNYFNDEYQGIPKGGYNLLIEGLLKDIEVKPVSYTHL